MTRIMIYIMCVAAMILFVAILVLMLAFKEINNYYFNSNKHWLARFIGRKVE